MKKGDWVLAPFAFGDGTCEFCEPIDLGRMFSHNISLRGGVAPVRAYIPDLMDQVLAERIDPSPVLEMSVDLMGVPEGYAAMDSRRKIKVMEKPEFIAN